MRQIFTRTIVLILLTLIVVSCTNKNTAINTNGEELITESSSKQVDNTPVLLGEKNAMIQYSMKSAYVNDEMIIDITLPKQYDKNKKYPVLYMTDGYWRRDEHAKIHKLSEDHEIEPVIVVGIGYPDDYDAMKIRERDLVNRADLFLSFIVDELIPFIDENYPNDTSNRTLWGASHGGNFVTYSLLQYEDITKDVFRSYIINSPTVWAITNGKTDFEWEESLYEKTKSLPVRVYFTVGGIEEQQFIDNYHKMVDQITDRKYVGLEFTHEVIPDKDHFTVWEPALMKGVKMFLGGE
ncbi:Ferri-bacillibactin esterase BesA [compost metagenome]